MNRYQLIDADLEIDIEIDAVGYDDPDVEIWCDVCGPFNDAAAQIAIGDKHEIVFSERNIRELCRSCIGDVGEALNIDLVAMLPDDGDTDADNG